MAVQTSLVAAPLRKSKGAQDQTEFDPYALLGVQRGDSLEEIRSRYRLLALAMHPDKGGSVDAFQRLSRTYEEVCAGLLAPQGKATGTALDAVQLCRQGGESRIRVTRPVSALGNNLAARLG